MEPGGGGGGGGGGPTLIGRITRKHYFLASLPLSFNLFYMQLHILQNIH